MPSTCGCPTGINCAEVGALPTGAPPTSTPGCGGLPPAAAGAPAGAPPFAMGAPPVTAGALLAGGKKLPGTNGGKKTFELMTGTAPGTAVMSGTGVAVMPTLVG